MTKEEFERQYIERSRITKEYYDEHFITLPCNCSDEKCEGWACVNDEERSIKTHNDLYA